MEARKLSRGTALVVLLAVVALGTAGLLSGRHALAHDASIDRLGTANRVVDAYLRAHEAVAVLADVENTYRDDPTLEDRRSFRAAQERLRGALADLARRGNPDDRRIASEVEAVRAPYERAIERQFQLVAARAPAAEVDRYDDDVIDPLSDELLRLVNGQAPVSGQIALRKTVELRTTASHSFLLALAFLGVLAALLTALVVATAMAHRRRAQAEMARISTQARYRRVLETGHDPYVAFDADGVVRDWNERAADLFGLVQGPEQPRVHDFFADQEDLPERISRRLASVDDEQRVGEQPLATALRRADGTSFAAEVSLWETEDDDGGGFFNVFIRDVEARVRLESDLRQAQKMDAIGQLAGGIAHDFNNLLTMIAGSGELARYELAAEHPARRDVDQIVAAVERGKALTQQLLTFSRRRPPATVEIDVTEATAATGELLERAVDSTISLRIEANEGAGTVLLEEGQLDQILINLVVNARDAIDGAGSISVECARADGSELEGDWVRLRVSDTGAGMDAATVDRIFEPFFTTKPERAGTGLGLATVYGIVQQAGGHVAVESEPGRGTTFTIHLPRAGDRSVSAAA